ncbi:MAG: MFS transporter [Blastocatellia bacterium]|nr:MFS transporter [Blastocatellia bacterium]MCS7158303.1 MFS transporter [Blastocatellia bacterium]MCX7753141.1 MFS transporter [Blastocatellia bacterium]MDW8169456.1 MFS transporter [Acidobacteriota bacterium]MDW8255730.1 MFS transporter [Acidobacteriota bacterium]
MSREGRRALLVIGLGHFVSDLHTSTLYPLLPLIARRLNLSEAEVFWLAPLLNLTSSLLQPVYGFLADRYTRRAFAIIGPAIAGSFISLIGAAPSYGWLVLFLILGGMGNGAFHPQGAALVARANAHRRRLALSIFSSSGTLGFALGPAIITTVVAATDVTHTYLLMPLGWMVALLIYCYGPREDSHVAPSNGHEMLRHLTARLRGVWRPMLFLYLITVSRSATYVMTNSYIPFILTQRGYGLRETGGLLTAYLLAGACGSFFGGAFAERFGGRWLTLGTGILVPLLLATAALTTGPMSAIALVAGGFVLMSVFPVNVATAQELASGETSTVSALMMGFAWGVGSMAPALCEPFTRTLGFEGVLATMAVFPLMTAFLALWVPEARAPELQLRVVRPHPAK